MSEEKGSEIDCYMKIIELYNEGSENDRNFQIKRDKLYIKLMEALKTQGKKDFVKNALVIVLSLLEDKPPDLYNMQGEELLELSSEKKNVVLSKLKDIVRN